MMQVKSIPPKLLFPYLENASLEDEETLQDKWAVLLVNMVDSKQNIENHVFPYILSQMSKDEFEFVESVYNLKKNRVESLREELAYYQENKESIAEDLARKLCEVEVEVAAERGKSQYDRHRDYWDIIMKERSLKRELSSLPGKEEELQIKMSAPQRISDQKIRDFEMANIIRLGLARVTYEVSAGSQNIEIPTPDDDFGTSVDFDLDIDTQSATFLTELGELFVDACQEKVA